MRSFSSGIKFVALLGGFFALSGAASAHHGSAEYKADNAVVLRHATVTKFLWANPHSMVLFDVMDEKGNVSHWAGEAGSPAAIRRLGWSKDSLHAGDVITVQLYPAKYESSVGRVDKIVRADGTTLENAPRSDQGNAGRY